MEIERKIIKNKKTRTLTHTYRADTSMNTVGIITNDITTSYRVQT